MAPHLLVGELMWDFHAPPSGTLEAPGSWRPVPGGAVSNVALELRSKGAAVAVGGSLCDTALGQGFAAALANRGIDVSLLAHDLRRTPLVFIEHRAVSHERYVAYRLGEVPTLPAPLKALACAPTSLLITGVLPDTSWCERAAALARILSKEGAVVGVDLNARPSAWRDAVRHSALEAALTELLSAASWVKGSAPDFQQLDPGFVLDELAAWGNARVPKGTLVLTQAAQPTLVQHQGKVVTVPVEPVKIRHSVGAGDAFCAGLIAGRAAFDGNGQCLHTWVVGAQQWAAERLRRPPPGIPSAAIAGPLL